VSDIEHLSSQQLFESFKLNGQGFDSHFWTRVLINYYTGPEQFSNTEVFSLSTKKVKETVRITKMFDRDGECSGILVESQHLASSLSHLKAFTELQHFLTKRNLNLSSKISGTREKPQIALICSQRMFRPKH
jgi:hypothetical protein